MKIPKLLLIAPLLTTNVASADQALKYGIQTTFGGETFIADGTTTTGSDTFTTDNNFKYGVYIIKPELVSHLSGKFALNSITGEVTYSDATEDFNAFSFDFLLMKEIFKTIYVGTGLTYHFNPSYTYTDASDCIDLNYDDALGSILEVTKVFDNGFEVGISYTNIEYTGIKNNYNNYFSETVDASGFALTAGFSF